jgi:ParB family chromosome partitioning protein
LRSGSYSHSGRKSALSLVKPSTFCIAAKSSLVEATWTRARERCKDRGPELGHENEVVEVSRLQRRVLTIVGEAQELASMVRDLAPNRRVFQAVLHNFVLTAFYRFATSGSCLEIGLRTPTFPTQAPGLRESASAKAVEARHESWKARLPKDEKDLWEALTALDGTAQASLFAHCASFAVNALYEPANRYNEGRVSAHAVQTRLDQADALARAVGLDMVQAGWKPTVDNYLGRVTKPRILEAVREAKGEPSAQLIDHLKKGDMAKEAERLLDGSGWLPEPLRLAAVEAELAQQDAEAGPLPEFLSDDEERKAAADEDRPQLDAAE